MDTDTMPKAKTPRAYHSEGGRKPVPDAERLKKTSFTLSDDDIKYLEAHQAQNSDGRLTGVAWAMRRIIREHREFSKKKR